jgi:hypothetical protein
MKNFVTVSFLAGVLFLLGCTKETERIVYPNGDPNSTVGSIVGLVTQKDSNARIVVRQASAIDSTIIDPGNGQFRLDNLPIGNYDLYIKASSYGTYWIRNVNVNAGGVTYVGEVKLSTVPDMVASIYPADQTEIAFDNRWSRLSISISFNKAMDRQSVEQALSINPPADGVFYWGTYSYTPTPTYFWNEDLAARDKSSSGAVITTYSKVRSFTYRMAQKDCYTDTTYTITLSTAAKDTAGNNMEFPLQFQFSTVQSATTQDAILTTPENGDIYVDPLDNSAIYMTFPRRMDQASVENGLTITPNTGAIFVWPADNGLKIFTGGPLMCETLYQIHLPATALDLDGVPLGEPFDFSFETAPVQIESVSPQSGEIFVARNARISFRFNTYMILSAVKSAVSIEPPIIGSFIRGYENGNNLPKDLITFIPSGSYAANTKYTVTVNTSAYDLHGTQLKSSYSFAFVTEPE